LADMNQFSILSQQRDLLLRKSE